MMTMESTRSKDPALAAFRTMSAPFVVRGSPGEGPAHLVPGNDAAVRLLERGRADPDALAELGRLLDRHESSFTLHWLSSTYRVQTCVLLGGRRGALLVDVGPAPTHRIEEELWAECSRRSPVPIIYVQVSPGACDVRQCTVVAVNDAARRLARWSDGEPVGRPLSAAFGRALGDVDWDQLSGVITTEGTIRELRCVSEQGPLRIRACFHGARIGMALEDVTYEAHIERSLTRQAERLAQCEHDLDQLTLTVALGVEEPLRVLRQSADLLLREPDVDGPRRAALDDLVGACRSARHTLNCVLEYVRMSEQELTARRVPLRSLLERLLEGLADNILKAGAQVALGRLPVVWGVEPELELIVRALLLHALESAGEPSADAPERSLRVTASATRDGWRIAIHEVSRPAFEAEDTLADGIEPSGAAVMSGGLPLVICRRIVERHGGRIGIFTDDAEGQTIWFEWPGHAREAREI